jgi:hypothetical protein
MARAADRLTWRCLAAGLIAFLLLGCNRQIEANPEEYVPISTVAGYLQMDDTRLDFVDGFVSVDYEPLEWHRYGFGCQLSHDQFSQAERKSLLDGKWTDLNHQSIPPGFPGPRANGDGERLSPRVSISIGRWPTAALPVVEDAVFKLGYGYFPTDFDFSGLQLNSTEIEEFAIEVGEPVRVRIHTKGERELKGSKLKWDIRFEGVVHEDTWPMRERWQGR